MFTVTPPSMCVWKSRKKRGAEQKGRERMADKERIRKQDMLVCRSMWMYVWLQIKARFNYYRSIRFPFLRFHLFSLKSFYYAVSVLSSIRIESTECTATITITIMVAHRYKLCYIRSIVRTYDCVIACVRARYMYYAWITTEVNRFCVPIEIFHGKFQPTT